jgi:DnaJ-class molecular chaperone
MIDKPENKMQAQQPQVCKVCNGQKTVAIKGGCGRVACHACRGTGIAQGTYATK